MTIHRCAICNKIYYYYNEICENPDYDAVSARFNGYGGDKGKWQESVNGICLVCADPYQEEIEGADISYFLDLCPDCMRTIINTAYNNGHSIDGLHSYEGYMKAQQSLKDGTVYPNIKEVFEGKIKEPSQDMDKTVKHILFKSLYNEGRKTIKDDFSSPKNQMICEREKQMICERYTALWDVVFKAGLVHEFEEYRSIMDRNNNSESEYDEPFCGAPGDPLESLEYESFKDGNGNDKK
ncbi:MAG: hypothetical protein IK990_20280 [Ruminiclostridium sp.]|nr:hypothetical protein [Ruminiclostridium sp.]